MEECCDYVELDINKFHYKPTCNHPTVVRQGEVASQTLEIHITDDGEPFDITGCRLYFNAKRSDGKLVLDPVTEILNAEKGYILYTIPAGIMVVDGVVQTAYFSIFKENEEDIITTENMEIVCVRGVVYFSDADYIPYIEKILRDVETLMNRPSLGKKILKDGEFDPETLQPIIDPDPNYIYLVPYPEESEKPDKYQEWMYLDETGSWEPIGNSNQELHFLTNEQFLDFLETGSYSDE